MSLHKSVLNFAGYDVSNLAAYVKEEEENLIARNIGEARTVQLLNLRDGIKHTERIHTLNDDVTWASGEGCGFTPGDATEFGKFDLSVAPIKWEKEWCNEDLVGFWPQIRLKAGASAQQEELPFEEAITNMLVAKNALKVDTAIWLSDTDNSTGDNMYFDGLAKRLNASGDVVEGNTGGLTSFTNANIYDALYDMILEASNTIGNETVESGTFKLFAGRNIMQLLLKNYIDNNWFHLDPRSGEFKNLQTIEVFGTGISLEVCPGLRNTNNIFGAKAEDLFIGTDGIGDTSEFRMWYNEDTDTIRSRSKFRLGTGVPFFDQTVKFTLESGS